MSTRVLAIDLGSSSVRAIVFESNGPGHLEMVKNTMARRPRHLESNQPGQATFSAASYLADLVSCVDELQKGGRLQGVTDVAIDSQWHSVLAVDGHGGALTDVVSWADTRASDPRQGPAAARPPDGRTSTGEGDMEEMRQRTGCIAAPMYWTWRLPWLSGTALAGLPGGGRYLGLAEYVGLHLLGDGAVSVAMASGTGLLATASHNWDDEAVRLSGAKPAQLPDIAPPGWKGRLTEPWRRRWPDLAGAAWHPALGDGAAANLGVGCTVPSRAAVTVGTSAAVRAVWPAPGPAHLRPGLWRYCVDRDTVVLGAAYSSGGQLYSWALSLWEGAPPTGGASSDHEPGGQLRYDLPPQVAAGSDGVLVLPWQSGTRPPAVSVTAGQGCVVGLGLGHGGAHIVSAAVEAVCFQLAGGLDDLEGGYEGRLDVVANGGAIERSPWWQERLAATLDRPVTFSAVPETTARGAAAHALGLDLGAGSLEGRPVVPSPDGTDALAEARQRWRRWYEVLLPYAASSF